MIDKLVQELSLTEEQQVKLEAWVKENVRNKTCRIPLTAEDVEAYGFSDEGHLIDTYRQKAAQEARLLHNFQMEKTVREDGKTNVVLVFTLQAVTK